MKLTPLQIFNEYSEGVRFKSALGTRGLYEQSKINERFFAGDQWHGARCGNDRPLVRHNVIKRIGEYKMSQVLSEPVTVSYSADGIPDTVGLKGSVSEKLRTIAKDGTMQFSGNADTEEINTVMSALGNYRNVTAERVGFTGLCEQMMRNAYISGSSVMYTYWDPDIKTGLYADAGRSVPISGDINCEVLDINDVYFGDPYSDNVQQQPYIIIASLCSVGEVYREAAAFGADASTLHSISEGGNGGKILVLTRLYKEYKENGEFSVMCTRVTERAVVRQPFDTRLRMYPITVFVWEKRNNMIYGDSEITYLIPNQIAINRMITAKVWAAMTMGMPLMVINGDTVTDNITNDPGQIIKIYGSNEDVAGAVKYVTPPDFSSSFDEGINTLIENTLTQSGANEASRGDSSPDNATAILALQNMSQIPLRLIRSRFYAMIEEIARIWADFWITQYGNRRIKMEDENGVWYMPFVSERYRDLVISARVDVSPCAVYSLKEQLEVLGGLYDKGIIDDRQYLLRLPAGIVPDVESIIIENDRKESEQ